LVESITNLHQTEEFDSQDEVGDWGGPLGYSYPPFPYSHWDLLRVPHMDA